MKVVITSGYFNPLHIGHLNLISESKKLGDFLIVIVNNDEQVKMKGSVPFMSQDERMEVVKALKYVDEAFLSIDNDRTVMKSLEEIFKKYQSNELIFAKGGDSTPDNVPEEWACKKFGARLIFGVGGGKIQSSSWLISNAVKNKII